MSFKLLQIVVEGNTGSTGRMAEAIGKIALDKGCLSYIANGRFYRPSKSVKIKIGSYADIFIHGLSTRIFDNHGFSSSNATRRLIKRINEVEPDIVHLHHLHGYYINIEILFNFLVEKDIPIVMTFHDCWAFTGHCAHFEYIGCDKWKKECNNCPQLRAYPASYFLDNSKANYYKKKIIFNSPRRMEIVTASNWMKECVLNSFLSKYPVNNIYNGVDLNIFRPITTEEQIYRGEFYKNKFILLGVASPFSERKGINDFFSLSSLLPKNYLIILVGVEIRITKSIPSNIKMFTKTENQQELVSLYNLADVYLNLTYEDTFPTTNLESLACGTPVITYNTGGSIESVDVNTGGVVEKGDLIELKKLLLYFEKQGKMKFSKNCRQKAENCFEIKTQLTSYFEIYDKLLN